MGEKDVGLVDNNKIFREIEVLSVKYSNFARQSFLLVLKSKWRGMNLSAVLIKRLISMAYRE